MAILTLIAALVAVGATAASYYQQKKMQKQAAKQANEMAAVQVSGHDSNRALYTVYGETLVGSTTVWKRVSSNRYGMTDPSFQNFSNATGADLSGNGSGKNNRYLYKMVALCNGPIEAVTNVVIDGEGYNASRFSVKGTNLHFAAATYRGETAGATLNNLVFGFPETAAMKGQEVAYSVERCYLHKDAPAFQGEPSTQYIVKGRKIYDPRKDSTSAYYNAALGVATHRSTTPTTWQWSDNPSLCLLDYLHSETYGRGLAYSDIDLASFVSAATKCEAQVAVPARLTNTTGNTIRITVPMFGIDEEVEIDEDLPNYRTGQTAGNTQNRYRLNLAVDGSADVLDNVQKILNCFKGNLIFANGKYTVTLDDVASPVLSLNNNDILGGLKITNGDRNQRINRATIKFLNSNKNYKTDQVSWPAIDSSEYTAYLTEDQGEKLHKTYTVEGCVDFYQAEDTAEYLVRDSRVTTTVSGKFGPRALGLVPGDVVSLTYDSGGYVGTYFRVNQVSLDVTTLEVTLQLREYDSSVYTWNASKGNEPLGLSWGEDAFNLEPGAPTLGTISHAVITSGDGSSVVQVTVPFADVPAEADSVAVAWSLQNADTFTTILMPDVEAQTSAVFIAPSDDATYTVELRYFITNLNGRVFPSATATSNYAVPAITGTKLAGIATGATVGATLGVDFYDIDNTSVLLDSGIRNQTIVDIELEDITAGSFVIGVTYVITSIGTTDFTLIGASDNLVGLVFTATGVGSGTGTVSNRGSVSTELLSGSENLGVQTAGEVGIYTHTEVTALGAQYSVKIENNGRVAGFGLSSTLPTDTNDPAFSNFVVVADKFAIVDPLSTDLTPIQPFTVTSQKIRMGTNVEIDGDLVTSGTISADKLKIDNVTLDTDGSGNLIVNNVGAELISGDVNTTNVIQNSTSLVFNGPSNEVNILEGSVPASTGAGHRIFAICSGYFDSTAIKTYFIRMYLRDTPTDGYVLASTTKVKASTDVATPFTIAGGTTAIKTGEVGVKVTIQRYGQSGITADTATTQDTVLERTCFIEGVR